MTYEEGILGIPKQFEYRPEVIGKDKIRPFKKIIVLGMGGSRLAGDVLNMVKPELDIHIHSDYDLPLLDAETLRNSLIIANSYSGNTVEPISGAKMAIERGLNLVIITTGGELLTVAQEKQVPHVLLPHTELPPRMMLGHDLMAMATLVGFDIGELTLCQRIDAGVLKSEGSQIAQQIGSAIPLIYTSERLNQLGYIWKIILNETAKIPAFHNELPEADHNEIAGFQKTQIGQFHAIFLENRLEHRIGQNMELTIELLEKNNIPVSETILKGDSLSEQIVSSIILAHWVALELATINNIEPLAILEIEDFKKKLQS